MIRMTDAVGRVRGVTSRTVRSAISPAIRPVWAAAGVVAVLCTAIAAFGGLNQADVTPMQLTEGDEAHQSLYAVTVLDAELTDEVEEEFLSADSGETLVILTMRLENLSDRPVGVGRTADRVESRLINVNAPLLALSDVTSEESTRVWRVDGSAGAVILQPGVPSEVKMAWVVPEDSFTDAPVRLDVYDATESMGQVILSADAITWRRTDLAATITVDVEDAG